MKADDYNGDLSRFLTLYKYHPELTKRLAGICGSQINQNILNEIVLWKVNRYVSLSKSIPESINSLEKLSHGEHRKASHIIDSLLRLRGVDLAMASTILRFQNPKVFAIIDRHDYRPSPEKN